MNTLLWIVQFILAIKLVTVTYTHGMHQSMPTIQEARQKMGSLAHPALYLAATFSLLAALGLTLPGILSLPAGVIPASAFLAALLLLGSLSFHVKYRPKPKVFVSLVLLALAVFIIVGRVEAILF